MNRSHNCSKVLDRNDDFLKLTHSSDPSASDNDSSNGSGNRDIVPHPSGGVTELDPQEKVKEPALFKVVLLNDDFTPMEFVIHVLRKFFNKNSTEAEKLMMEVHQKGSAIAGLYPLQIAEMKVIGVTKEARKEEHPLKVILEEDS